MSKADKWLIRIGSGIISVSLVIIGFFLANLVGDFKNKDTQLENKVDTVNNTVKDELPKIKEAINDNSSTFKLLGDILELLKNNKDIDIDIKSFIESSVSEKLSELNKEINAHFKVTENKLEELTNSTKQYIANAESSFDLKNNITEETKHLDVMFTDQSNNNAGNIAGWGWNFSDRNYDTEPNPIYEFQNTGTYSPALSVREKGVYRLVKTNPANVEFINEPSTEFSADITSGIIPLNIMFKNNSIGSSRSFVWDFGDDNNCTQQNQEHIYKNEGIYNVQLQVSNSIGGTPTAKIKILDVIGSGKPNKVQTAILKRPENNNDSSNDSM